MREGRFATAANAVSIARIPLGGLASLLLVRGMPAGSAVLAFLAVATDWLDGFLARRTGTVSDWGRILDPLADKAAFGLFAWALVRTGALRPWILITLVSRDVLIGLGGVLLARRASPPSARFSGKLSTLLMALFLLRQAYLPSALLPPEPLPGADLLGMAALTMLLASLADYAIALPRTARTEPRRCA